MSVALYSTRHAKEAKMLADHARKLLHRRMDVLSAATVADVQAEIGKLEAASKTGDEAAIKEASERLDKVFVNVQPVRGDSGWRENCEVLLVAFVLAIAIRAYFLQPFKIPTGSMEPTLNGITAHFIPADKPIPGLLGRAFESLWFGRTYVNAVSAVDDQVVNFQSETHYGFMEYTRVLCASGRSYLVHATVKALTDRATNDAFGLRVGRRLHAGESIVRGYVQTGDQVFVDKFTYNFRRPQRADVFVFSTRDIAGIQRELQLTDPNVKSEFYIKRLAAVGGDTLRIDDPRLFLNGKLAPEAAFQRVMGGKDGYRGYSNPPAIYQFHYLLTPDDTFTLPPKTYFALGDNSRNSSDSRNWGVVPEDNVVGRGLLVYWPFTKHWGLIH